MSTTLRHKVLHARKYIKSEFSILEITVGEKNPGEFAGFINKLITDKTKHTVLVDRDKEKAVTHLRNLAKAKYSIATSVSDKADAVLVTEASVLSLNALLTYLGAASEFPPKLVIWEHPHMKQNDELHDSIRKRVEELGLSCHVRGRENVYVLGDKPDQFAFLDNPPLPSMLQNVTGLMAIFIIGYIVYAIMSYFLSSTVPTTKSLANNPT
jgi:hypothetical protein